ncbi:MAG: protein phosphatase 2C domain-containing protein [Kofleriaceae bacterium]
MTGSYLTCCARTDVGMRRSSNEDAFLLIDLDAPTSRIACTGEPIDVGARRMLLAVSDGMGGAAAGEVASSLALATLARALQVPSDQPLDRQLEAAVQAANSSVLEAAVQRGQHGMGATLTAIVIANNTAWIAEVGDSRAYLLRGGSLRQLTRDQSYVQMLVDIGAIDEEAARQSTRRNVILQAVGTQPRLQVALGRLDLRRGDRLLLCSDGLSNEIEDAELATLLSSQTPAVACEHAVARANEHGGKDNVTVIVAVVEGDAVPLSPPNETITGTHRVIQDYKGT